jgi:hypothetical protein
MDEFKSVADRLVADPAAKQAEQEVIARYGELFNPKNIDNLTADDFKSFLLFKNNRHWSGIFRYENLVTIEMARLREAIRILVDESQPLEKRLNVLYPPNKPNYIKGMGKAVATPILLVVYPDKYGVWNEPSQQGLKRLNLLPQFSRGASFTEKYVKINKVLNDLARQYNLSLWQVDGVLGDLMNAGPSIIRPAVAEEVIEAEQIKEAAEAEFGLESHLEDFIIENWDNLELGKKYALLDNDCDMISKQFPTDVGPIDILARSKDSKEWLVIELKKGRSGDQVVGQIQRYMGWVLRNRIKQGGGESVKGLIILKNTDTKLEYALEVTHGIELMTYSVTFSLNKLKMD